MSRADLTPLERMLNLLGLARRARVLEVGQDRVFEALRSGAKQLVLTANDISPNVLRHVTAAVERGTARHLSLAEIDRTALGAQLGVASAQIVAIPSGNGLAIKILNIYENRE